MVAEVARVSLNLDEVRFLVAGDPWMKTTSAPGRVRVEMTRLAVADNPSFRVDARETERSGPTYTVETLEELHAEEPGTSWVFVLGADAARSLPRWRRADELFGLARFAVAGRPGYDLDPEDEWLKDLEQVAVPLCEVSSTDLRARFANGAAVRYQLPRAVEELVRDRGLYGAEVER